MNQSKIETLNMDDVHTLREEGSRIFWTRRQAWREGEKMVAEAHIQRRGMRPLKVHVILGKARTQETEQVA